MRDKDILAYQALGLLRMLREFGHVPAQHRAHADHILQRADEEDRAGLALMLEEDRNRAEQDAQDVLASQSHTEER